MTRCPRFVFAGAMLASIACGPRQAPPVGQILLSIDTDAPLPSAAGTVSMGDPMPLFDRVLIDLYPPGATDPCAGCTNDFAVNADLVSSGQASVGVVPSSGITGYRARVRLTRAAFELPNGDPDPNATIDVTIALPAIGVHDIVQVTAFLPTASTALPMGSLDEPVAPQAGTGPSRVGTWAPAQRTPCSGAATDDEVCIVGGAYWMGNPASASLGAYDGTQVRLVTLSPFFLDKTEVTVGKLRPLASTGVTPWSGSTGGVTSADWCTFTPSSGPYDAYPVNCVTWSAARAYCQARGGDLPTEAQFEYVAGGLESNLFVWGLDSPSCPDAVYDRGGNGILSSLIYDYACPATDHGGPLPPGSGALDRLDLPGGVIVDLAGDLSEWQLDMWNRSSEPCWAKPGIYPNPLCAEPSPADGPERSVRGADWLGAADALPAAARFGAATEFAPTSLQNGFRCARPSP